MTEHVRVRQKLKSIRLKEDFNVLLDKCVLTDRERLIMESFYLKGKTIVEIADELDLSNQTILKAHGKILDKISEFI